MANINLEIVLVILFLNFSNIDVKFVDQTLIQRFYTPVKILEANNQMDTNHQLEKICSSNLRPGKKAFIMHMAYIRVKILIHLTRKA